MIITVTDFEKVSGISRNTIYSWFYRDIFPEGISKVETLGEIRLLYLTSSYENYNSICKKFKQMLKSKTKTL